MKHVANFFSAFRLSLSLFSIFPAGKSPEKKKAYPYLLLTFPLVGLIIGVCCYGLALGFLWLKIPNILASSVLALFPFLVTRFLHVKQYVATCNRLDLIGIAPTPDIPAAFSPNSIQGILYAFIPVTLSVASSSLILAKHLALFLLIFIPVVSRSLASLSILHLKAYETDRFSSFLKSNHRPAHTIFHLSVLFLLLLAFTLTGGFKGLLAGLAIVAAFGIAIISSTSKRHGMSAEAFGFAIVISEMVGIFFLSVLF